MKIKTIILLCLLTEVAFGQDVSTPVISDATISIADLQIKNASNEETISVLSQKLRDNTDEIKYLTYRIQDLGEKIMGLYRVFRQISESIDTLKNVEEREKFLQNLKQICFTIIYQEIQTGEKK